MTPARTPLHAAHVRAGARLVDFAGFELPVQYAGVTAEAKAVRERVGMFDVSHMGRLRFDGEGATEFLEWATTNDVETLAIGRGHYSLLPNETGGVVDDIILYRTGDEAYRMVVNSSNHAKDVAHLLAMKPQSVAFGDETAETAMIAVQGPRAADVLAAMTPEAAAMRTLPLFGTLATTLDGVAVFLARSGYTGEDGFELIVAAADAERLWEALLAAGVEPCGLGARDALRVEAGLPLYGHELADDLSPLAAALGWAIGKEKEFLGSDAVDAARAAGTPTKLMGVRLEGKRLLPPGTPVLVEGHRVGEVTSGVIAPKLEVGIALAYVRSELKAGTPVEVEVRGSRIPATLTTKRFLKSS